MKTLFAGALALAALTALPAASFAATYAFVNTDGEVRTMEASTATQALTTAPNLHVHSGVMLLDDDGSDIVGDKVPGT